MDGIIQTPNPVNEPAFDYAPGTATRHTLQATLAAMREETRDLPSIIDGQEITGPVIDVRSPHDHHRIIARTHQAGESGTSLAIVAAMRARHDWAALPFEQRAAVFLRAAELFAGPYRARINATTMLGQGKTAHQAEIDSACELIDFLRFNVHYARKLQFDQPISTHEIWNQVEHRPLDGFVLAITPFNFTAIAGNLPTAPALLGNTVVWKPASSAALSNQVIMDVLREAGLPNGVINLVHGTGPEISNVAMMHPDLAGVHFTGSTQVFKSLWSMVGQNINTYKSYPRLVGETGGKDFIVAHPSADIQALAVGLIRGAFEYQGQKCSAASRAYIPESMWPELSERLIAEVSALKVGDTSDFSNFMGAVIDERAYRKIAAYIDLAKEDSSTTIVTGGTYDDSTGYFIQPTIVLTTDPKHRLMREEIFGPVLTIYCYPDAQYTEMLKLVDETAPYALTGSIFARDRYAILQASNVLRFAAGNFYINDKCTGAVVGQQPFGGGRASGTNDKAGSPLNLLRWINMRTVKENLKPPLAVGYPYML